MIAENRHHRDRVRAKRQKHHFKGKVATRTPAVCSCWMCGNPRKWFGIPTIQERRMFQEFAE